MALQSGILSGVSLFVMSVLSKDTFLQKGMIIFEKTLAFV
jgi:hypothetical protein